VGLTVCRSKKEDWLPKKERNQRRPGCRRSQEDFGGIWWAPCQGPVPSTNVKIAIDCNFQLSAAYFLCLSYYFYWVLPTFYSEFLKHENTTSTAEYLLCMDIPLVSFSTTKRKVTSRLEFWIWVLLSTVDFPSLRWTLLFYSTISTSIWGSTVSKLLWGGWAWPCVGRRKKTGCRRRNVIKEDLDAEDRKRIQMTTGELHARAQCHQLTVWDSRLFVLLLLLEFFNTSPSLMSLLSAWIFHVWDGRYFFFTLDFSQQLALLLGTLHFQNWGGWAWPCVGRRKKTGCRRRIVIKEDLDAEDRKRIWMVLESSMPGPSVICLYFSYVGFKIVLLGI